MRKMIFIGGIHGVGKTYLCNNLSRDFNVANYSASKLISERKQEELTKNKTINNINQNQDFLIEALENLYFTEDWFILDGHFCLMNNEGNISKIPIEIFKSLAPISIIVLTDSIDEIYSRLYSRDNIKYDLSLLDSLQKEELDYSKEVSIKLNIPLFIYNIKEDSNAVYEFIGRTLKEEPYI